MAKPRGVHFVGSIPLSSTQEVFQTLCDTLGDRLVRIPDGETAERHYFVQFQRKIFPSGVWSKVDSNFERIPSPPPSKAELNAVLSTLKNAPLESGYDTYALDAWRTFQSMQASGKIPSPIKFQVSLPTMIDTMMHIADGYQLPIEPYYEDALLRALQQIENEVPHSQLSIQWDIAVPFALIEGNTVPRFQSYFEPIWEGIVERVVRLVGAVSPDVDVGLHLCYGDIQHRHFVEPKDMQHLVGVARDVTAQAKHPVTYIHMPVPKDRFDAEYFASLEDFDFGDTALYLGLVHFDDLDGTRRRIAAASRALQGRPFGVATECGMGRTPPEHLNSILEILGEVSQPM